MIINKAELYEAFWCAWSFRKHCNMIWWYFLIYTLYIYINYLIKLMLCMSLVKSTDYVIDVVVYWYIKYLFVIYFYSFNIKSYFWNWNYFIFILQYNINKTIKAKIIISVKQYKICFIKIYNMTFMHEIFVIFELLFLQYMCVNYIFTKV